MMATKKITTLNFPLSVLNAIDELIELGLYNSRSQIIRIGLKEFLQKEEEYQIYLDSKPKKVKQKIITVNLEKRDIKTMKKLVGNEGEKLYFSRSELVRVAIRDFLIKVHSFDPVEIIKVAENTIERNSAGEEIVTHKKKKWRILAPGLEYV